MKTSSTQIQLNTNNQTLSINPVSLPDPSTKTVEIKTDNIDTFVKPQKKSKLPHPQFIKDAQELYGKPLNESTLVPWPSLDEIRSEENFIAQPTVDGFLNLEKEFNKTMRIVGHQKFDWVKEISIAINNSDFVFSDAVTPYMSENSIELEEWHRKKDSEFIKDETKTKQKANRRHEKIAEKGLGYGGHMTKVIANAKSASYFAKNNFTIRGNMFKLIDKRCPKNIFEIMPRFGYRKGAHVGVRVSQFTINAILAAIGYAFVPVTFGVSKIVCNHLNTVVTLSGECITRGIAGADKPKIATHAALRGVQLELPLVIPVAGQFIYYGEYAAFATAAIGIVSTTLADAIMAKCSTRYTQTGNIDDIGDSTCLRELNRRIDYLSQFFLPYGQYLLLKESNIENRKELKKTLKTQFKTLRDLEKKKIESLNYYRLALAAEKIPDPYREKIQKDCELDKPEEHMNTHRKVKACLAALIEKDAELNKLPKEKKAIAVLSEPV